MLSISMDGVPQWQDQGPSPIPNHPNTDVLPQKTGSQIDNSAIGAGGPGVLTVDGDEGAYSTDDHIVLRLDPNRSDYIQAIVNNVTEYDGPYSPFQSIVINGISGKDTIDVQDVPLGVSVTTIEAGSELSDQISAVNVGKNHRTSGILGTITVTDPSDQAILNIDDSGEGSASKDAIVTNSAVTGLGLAPGTIGYSQGALAALNIQTGTGGGAIKVKSTPTGLLGTITRLIDNGPYAVTVGDDNGKTQGVQGTLRISNSQHDDTVNLDDSGDDDGSNVTIDTITPPGDTAYGRVRGLAPNGTIEFHIGDVNSPVKIQTGMGYNEVDVLATLAAISIISHGPDTVVIGSDLSGRAGNVQSIHGDVELLNEAKPREYTNLEINDSADQASDTVNKTRTVTITNSAVTGLAPARISYKSSQLAELFVNGPSVACTYNVLSTPNHGAAGKAYTTIVTFWSDTLNIGDAGSVQGIVGTLDLDVHGRARVKIDDSRDMTSQDVDMTDDELTGLSPGPIFYNPSGLSALNIMTGIVADRIGVESTPDNVKGVTTTFIDQAANNIHVVSNPISGSSIAGTLIFEGSPGLDTLHIDDSGDRSSRNAWIDTDTPPGDSVYGLVQGLFPGTVEFRADDVKSPVIVKTGINYNVVNILTTIADITVDSSGPARVNIGNAGSVQGIQGNVRVVNDSRQPRSYTTLVVDDSTDHTSRTVPITITKSAITGLAPAIISYLETNLSSLAIQGGYGSSTYNVQSTPNHGAAGTVETTITGRGQDTVNVGNAGDLQGITGWLDINNLALSTTLNVDDSSDFTSRVATITRRAITGLSPGPIVFDESELHALTILGGIGPAAGLVGLPQRFDVLSTPNNSPVYGTLRTTIITGPGGQRINVGGGGRTNEIDGDLYVQALPGATNRVVVDDSANVFETPISIDQHTDAGALFTQVSFGRGNIDVANGSTVALRVSGGYASNGSTVVYSVNGTAPNTTVTVNTHPAARSAVNIAANSGTVTVNTHGAADVVNLGDPANTVDSILGTINVNRVEGADTLNVNDQGESAPEDYEATQDLIRRAPLPYVTFIPTQTINYSGVTNVFINGGTARDLYGVGGQSAGTSRTVNGGTAFNEWNVYDDPENLDSFQAPLTLHGSSGLDEVFLYDYLNAAPHTYTVTAQAVSRDGIEPINYSGLGDIVLITPLIGGSTVNVGSTSAQAAMATTIVSEAGDNVVVGADAGHGQHSMQAIAGLLVITTRGGAAAITLDDSGNPNNGFDRTVTFSADPTYNMIIGGLAPANIYLPVGAGTNVSVIGNADDETFAVDGLPSGFNLNLDGQFGNNTLDYSGYSGDVSVNLALGTATGLSGIEDFQNVIGSQGNDVLVGNANANILRGGTGRNILIGGGGADQLSGGGGDNILIGGTTDYNLIDAALEAFKREWDRTDIDFARRIADLEAGVDAGGVEVSLTANTVHADQAIDTLDGGGQNWFFVAQGDPDLVDDPKDGDLITPI